MSGGTRSFEMARRLVLWGHEVNLVTTRRDGNIEQKWTKTIEEGIRVHWLSVPYNNSMGYDRRIKAFLKYAVESSIYGCSLESDIVFATSTPLTVALPAVYIAKKKNIPLVFEVRDLWPEIPIAIGAIKGPLIPMARWLERFAYRNSKKIIALSPGMKDGIAKTGFPTKKVHVIPNSADLDMFDVSDELGSEFRKRYEWIGNRPLVVYTGALGKINGVGYFVDLAASVFKKEPNICFLVIGEGAEKEKILAKARSVGILKKNFFMLPALPKHVMPAVLSAADIATSLVIDMPQLWANSANKFFDALASGTPIAINYNGWQADLLKETGAGIILDRKDISEASRKLLSMLQNAALLQTAGVAARKLAKNMFLRDNLAKKLETILVAAANNASS